MFIIDLNYIVPLEKLDFYMSEHVKYLNKYYKLNKFVVSGRKVPRTGGIILALADSREEINRLISEDPFFKYELAEFTVTEFITSQINPALESFFKKNNLIS